MRVINSLSMFLSNFHIHFSSILLLSLPFLVRNAVIPTEDISRANEIVESLRVEKFFYGFNVSQISTLKKHFKGEHDIIGKSIYVTEDYVYFTGKPTWSRRKPMTLTYAFSSQNLIDYLSLQEIRIVFRRAFSRWASVVPITFVESFDYAYADIRIGFYTGDHGDGQAFDGVLGILAHSFSPETGKLHLDKSERWAVDFGSEQSKVAVDLESVAVHEIGHVLGLAHSSMKGSVMYPSLKPRERRVDLTSDDVKGIQSLYGSKHGNRFGSLFASESTSTNDAIGLDGVSRIAFESLIRLGLIFFHAM